jgi:plasmid stability protein
MLDFAVEKYVLHEMSCLGVQIMTNLTIALDETVIKNARIRAINEGTSVSAKVREFLSQYAQGDTAHTVGQGFLEMARESKANIDGAKWTRDDAYDRTKT